jgi:CRP-like cAMP-binding protein
MTTTRPTRILILGAGQGETPIRRLGPGDCFGEIALLGDQIWPFKLSAFIVITSLDTSSLSRDSGRMPTRSSRSRLKKSRSGSVESRAWQASRSMARTLALVTLCVLEEWRRRGATSAAP